MIFSKEKIQCFKSQEAFINSKKPIFTIPSPSISNIFLLKRKTIEIKNSLTKNKIVNRSYLDYNSYLAIEFELVDTCEKLTLFDNLDTINLVIKNEKKGKIVKGKDIKFTTDQTSQNGENFENTKTEFKKNLKQYISYKKTLTKNNASTSTVFENKMMIVLMYDDIIISKWYNTLCCIVDLYKEIQIKITENCDEDIID